MSLPLLTFEQFIPFQIAGRALDYYERGAVASLARDGDTYTATVNGTAVYQVEVEVEDEQVTNWQCTCPYDYGPICKHVAAALYEVRKKEFAR